MQVRTITMAAAILTRVKNTMTHQVHRWNALNFVPVVGIRRKIKRHTDNLIKNVPKICGHHKMVSVVGCR